MKKPEVLHGAAWRSVLVGGRVKFANAVYQHPALEEYRTTSKHRAKVLVRPPRARAAGPLVAVECCTEEDTPAGGVSVLSLCLATLSPAK